MEGSLEIRLQKTLDPELVKYDQEMRMLISDAIDANLSSLIRAQTKKVALEKLKRFVSRNAEFDYLIPVDKPPDIYFITINFIDDLSNIDLYLKTIKKFSTLTYIKGHNYVYSIEQRAPLGDDFKGMHMHMVVDRKKGDNYKKSKMIDAVYRTFKKCVGSKESIHIRDYPQSYRNDKIEYMKGNKDEPDKDLLIQNDLLFREKYNLKSLYTLDADED